MRILRMDFEYLNYSGLVDRKPGTAKLSGPHLRQVQLIFYP